MSQYIFVNEKAFERKQTSNFGKEGEKYLALQVVVSSGRNGRKDSIIVFENSIEDFYQKVKEARDRFLADRDNMLKNAWEQWIKFKEEQN